MSLELEGMIQRLKMRRMEIQASAGAKLKALRSILATSAITPLGEIDIEGAYELIRELKDMKAECLEITEKIKTAEKELRGY